MKRTYGKISAILFAIVILLTASVTARCATINIDYCFATKAASGEEADKSPTYVPGTGGYLPDENIACNASKVNFAFLGAHYANDRGAGLVRVEVYDAQGRRVGAKSVQVDEWIRSWQDVSDRTKRKKYSGSIDLGQQTSIRRVRIFVIPGNRAVVINDMNISFR